jgi:hypothetical protein
MRSKESDALIVLPLLPIFLVGLFPMLMIGLLGFAGLVILGVLLTCAGLADGLEAHSSFNQQVIVHGCSRHSERARYSSLLHSATRAAALTNAAGIALMLAGLLGLFCAE